MLLVSPSSPPLPFMEPACKRAAISGSVRKRRAQPPPPQMLAQALLVSGVMAAACRRHGSHTAPTVTHSCSAQRSTLTLVKSNFQFFLARMNILKYISISGMDILKQTRIYFVYVYRGVRRPLWVLVLFFHHGGPGVRTQVVKPGCRSLCPLRHISARGINIKHTP